MCIRDSPIRVHLWYVHVFNCRVMIICRVIKCQVINCHQTVVHSWGAKGRNSKPKAQSEEEFFGRITNSERFPTRQRFRNSYNRISNPKQQFLISIGGRTRGSGNGSPSAGSKGRVLGGGLEAKPKPEHFCKKVDNSAAIFASKCLESRLKYRVRNTSTGTCKTHKSYNDINAFDYYWNVLNSEAI